MMPETGGPAPLNSVLLSTLETLSNVTISSEIANKGSSGGSYYDLWGQVVVASNSGTITFANSTTLSTVLGSNWTAGEWFCNQLSIIRIL